MVKKQCWNILFATLLIESSLLTNILLREKPFMILIYPYLKYPYFPSFQKICWNCGRSASETCSGCNYARYCSQFCQHKDWENHHKVCKPLPSSATAINGGHTSTSGILTPSAGVTFFWPYEQSGKFHYWEIASNPKRARWVKNRRRNTILFQQLL